MSRFRFRLQRVLEHLELQEQQHSQVVAECKASIVTQNAKIHEHKNMLTDAEDYIRAHVGNMSMSELQAAYAHHSYVQQMIVKLEEQLHLLQERLEREREILVEKSKRKNVVAELKERKRMVFDQDEMRYETALVDESNARRRIILNSLSREEA